MRVRHQKTGQIGVAYQWDGNEATIASWMGGYRVYTDPHHGPVLELGPWMIRRGSWIVWDQNREMSVHKDDQFRSAYVNRD